MSELGERDAEELIWLLRHRVRRNIIITIGDAGKISATALRDRLRVSTGSLYYNLRQLERLVVQDQSRNYTLTEQGARIYKLLKEKGDVTLSELVSPQSRTLSVLSSIFFPIWLLAPLLDRTSTSLLVGVALQALLAALMFNAKTELIVMHVYHRSVGFTTTSYITSLFLTFVAAYFFFSIVSYAYEVLRRREGERGGTISIFRAFLKLVTSDMVGHKLLAAIMIGLAPMGLYPAASFVDRVLGGNVFSTQSLVPTSLIPNATLIISQMVSFIVMTTGLSYVKKLPWHVAALTSFSLIYMSIVVQYVIFRG